MKEETYIKSFNFSTSEELEVLSDFVIDKASQIDTNVFPESEFDPILKTLWENLPLGIRIINADGNIAAVNNAFCRLFEAPEEKLIGKHYSTTYQKNGGENYNSPLALLNNDCTENKTSGTYEARLKLKSGKVLDAEIRNRIIKPSSKTDIFNKKEVQILSIFQDRTQLKESKKKFIEFEKSMGLLTHEIKAPLATIKANVEIIEGIVNNSDKTAKSYSIINDEIKRVDRILKSLFLYTHKINLSFSKINLPGFMKEIKESFLPILNDNNINLNIDVDNFQLQCDYTRLRIAFSNLIDNSIESICRQTERNNLSRGIYVFTENHDNNYITIMINDTGCGLYNEEDIFEPFFTTKTHGIGLGLTIAKKIIELHNGEIKLLKSKPGYMIFEIRLPIIL